MQVQTDKIKTGSKPHEIYTPLPNLRSVQSLTLDADGVQGVSASGDVLPDVHNATHPHSRFRGENGISVLFTSHYAEMRERFGNHLTDGIAGENVLVETDRHIPLDDIGRGIQIGEDEEALMIAPWIIAEPCAPFSRFCLKYEPDQRSDRLVTETLRFLGHGMRGYTTVWSGDAPSVHITLGQPVYQVTQ